MRTKRKFLVLGIAGTLLVAGIAAVLTASSTSRDLSGRLEELRGQAKKLGLPATLSDVPLSGPVPDGSNAALLLRQAADEPDNDAAVKLLLQAAGRSACRFDFANVTDFHSALAPFKLKRAIDLLLDSATEDLSAAKDSDARRKIHAAFMVSKFAGTYPAIECLEESIRLERHCYERIAVLMNDMPTSQSLMPVVQAEVFNPRDRRQLSLALRQFAALGNEIATKRELDGDQKVSWLWGSGDFPGDPWGRAAVEARHLEGVIRLIEDLDTAHTWPAAMRTVSSQVEEWQKDARPVAYTLREASKNLAAAPRMAAENEAARRILFVAAAVYRHKQRYGEFPAQSPVQGAMGQDPFADKPLTYSREGNGFWIASIGSDELPVGPGQIQGIEVGDEVVFKYSGPPLPE